MDELAEKTGVEGEAGAEESRYAGMTRRELCGGVAAAAAVVALGGGLKVLPSTPVVRPPGGQDEGALVSKCIRCQKCYEACPHHVIVPSHLEDGLLQMRTPTVDFSSSWCDFCAESNDGRPLCVECCPTGALSLPETAEAETTIIGVAEITADWCLAYRLIGCKFCYDACPYEAIELDGEGRPSVIADRCNGCGACESVCVSLSSGSISAGATDRAIVIKPID